MLGSPTLPHPLPRIIPFHPPRENPRTFSGVKFTLKGILVAVSQVCARHCAVDGRFDGRSLSIPAWKPLMFLLARGFIFLVAAEIRRNVSR